MTPAAFPPSLWTHAAPPPPHHESSAPLGEDLRADVVIIGGGITGLMTALQLSDAGYRVALVEAGAIARANTGLSTGNLYTPVSGMAELTERWGGEVVAQVRALRSAGIRAIERAARRLTLDCGLRRVPMQYALEHESRELRARFERELRAYERAGLAPRACRRGLPFAVAEGFRVEGQAQFDPYRFCIGLASLLSGRVRLFEMTPALEIDAATGCVTTPHGRIHADHIVLATHSPSGFNLVQAEMEAYREYAIAVPVTAAPLPGIHWIRDSERSLRAAQGPDGSPWLVAVGGRHRTGEWTAQQDESNRLHAYARERFDVRGRGVSWSAQQFKPADGLPYIGRSAHANVWMATGFQADGLTWGAVAAQLITEGIAGIDTEAARLLSPRRLTPLKSARGWARTNATVFKHMVGDRLARDRLSDVTQVPAGTGALVRVDGQRRAVYRDDGGALHVLSPICPHMKCIVQWNDAAASWDCPCHGSRFAPTGELLEGPALQGLQPVLAGSAR